MQTMHIASHLDDLNDKSHNAPKLCQHESNLFSDLLANQSGPFAFQMRP